MKGAIAAVVVLVPALVSAQDTNYWTEQYGNQARLLAGAVIGSADDLSAVYYNPGAFALVKKPELLLAGNVVQYESLDLQNSLGTGNDLKSSHFGGAPSLFAGELRLGFLGRSRLAYSFLTRQEFNLTAEQRGQVEGQSLFPGVSFYEANVSFDQRLGSSTTERGLPLIPGQEEIGLPTGLDVSYFRLTFILGFNFQFN